MEYSAVYEQKSKLIDKFDPRTKLAWYCTMIYFSLSCKTSLQLSIVLMIGFTVSLLLTGSLKQYKPLFLLMGLLGIQMFILQLLFCREGILLYHWGIIKIYSEAIPLAVTGMLKATIIAFASMQFLTSACAMDFILMLLKFKIPYRYAMLVGLSQRFLPLMINEYVSIIESQSTRGMKMENVWDNLKSVIPTFLPFLYRAVRRSTELALAMELRGYGRSKTRTFSYDLSLKNYDISLIVGMLLVITIHFLMRIFLL